MKINLKLRSPVPLTVPLPKRKVVFRLPSVFQNGNVHMQTEQHKCQVLCPDVNSCGLRPYDTNQTLMPQMAL